MKKAYISPETLLTVIATQQLMTGSNGYGQPEQGQNLEQVETTEATSGNLSRRRTVWDDEELEEEEEF